MEVFIWSLISIAGLCFGSFINVLIYRTESGESILFPPSKCPKCDVPLLWWQKIPLFSYFYLNGRCYYCNKIISIQYPVVEFLGLLLFIFSFSAYKSIVDAVCVIGIISLFFTQAVLDTRIKKISTIQGVIIAILGIVFNRYDIVNSISGMLVGGLIIYIAQKIGKKYFNKEIFGTGDIILFGALGSVVCFDKIFLYIFYSFLLQVAITLPMRWKNLKEKSDSLQHYLFIFGITCFFLYIIKNREFFAESLVYVIFLAILLYSAYFATKELILVLKDDETPQYCALAPAVAIACLVFLI